MKNEFPMSSLDLVHHLVHDSHRKNVGHLIEIIGLFFLHELFFSSMTCSCVVFVSVKRISGVNMFNRIIILFLMSIHMSCMQFLYDPESRERAA